MDNDVKDKKCYHSYQLFEQLLATCLGTDDLHKENLMYSIKIETRLWSNDIFL